MGNGQTSISTSGCNCNEDQTENGARDGSFIDTVFIKGITATGDIYFVDSLLAIPNGLDSLPSPLWENGYGKFQSVGDSIYRLIITHYDSSGYRLSVTGPRTSMVDTTMKIENVCIYPVIVWDAPGVSASYNINDATVNLNLLEIHGESGDTSITLNGSAASSFLPADLGIGNHTLTATFNGDFNDQTGTIDSPGFPGCNTELTQTIAIRSDSVIPNLCVCTDTIGGNSMPFMHTIDFADYGLVGGDSFYLSEVSFFQPNTQILVISAFFEENDYTGNQWNVGDTLEMIGTDTFQFKGYGNGDRDATLTFISTDASPDTIKVNISSCGNVSSVAISGPDTICQADYASFSLNTLVDSVTWTIGDKYTFTTTTNEDWKENIDTSGLITVRASGSIQGTCLPFTETKQVYVQPNDFEINGSEYVCLFDTLSYNLDLKGDSPNYNTAEGLKWSLPLGGGRFIGDSVNVLTVMVEWGDTMNTSLKVEGETLTGCEVKDSIEIKIESILSGHIKGPKTVCLGNTEGYKTTLENIDVLTWTVNPDSAGTVVYTSPADDSVNIQWHYSGTHEVIVNGTADGGKCVISDTSFTVEVLDTSYVITGFDAACMGDSTGFGLRDNDGNPVDLVSLTWTVIRNSDNGSIATQDTFISDNMSGVRDSINVRWDSLGTHTVMVTGETANGCIVTESKTVTVRDTVFSIFGDNLVCFGDTTIYMVYDANDMGVTNMDSITWTVFQKGQPDPFMTMSDDTIYIDWSLVGDFTIFVDGVTEDGCRVSDSLDVSVINTNDLKIVGPSKLLGIRDTIWTLNAPDSVLNNVQWKIINSTGFPSVSQITQDTFRLADYSFFNELVYDSMNIVVNGMVGTSCTFTDTIPFILRDTSFQIFGDPIVCNISDSSIYYVDVPGIESISWSVSGTGNMIEDTLGADKDSVLIEWATNGTITATINTVDGCTITDSLIVFVRDGSVILGDTAVSELDTVVYTLKGLTATDTLDFTDLTSISWTYPSNATGMTINSLMDSIQVVYHNQDGEPFYIDSISVSYMTNDGCVDTITQLVQIRESSYGLMGMEEVCQDGEFKFTFGSLNDVGDPIDLPTSVIADIAYVNWILPDGGTVVSSSDDMATFNFDATGQHRIMVSGAFTDSCKFEFIDSINVRSNLLELHGDTDGFVFDGQTTSYDIMEVDKGVSSTLSIDQLDGILWAVEDHGDMPGSSAYNARASLNSVLLASTAVAASPLSGTQSSVGDTLAEMVISSGLVSDLNNEYRGMISNVSATFNTAGQDDHLFVGLVTTAGCTFSQTLDIAINNNNNTGSIACNNLVNVAMGPDCIFDVTPDLILEDVGDDQFDEYSIRITELNGTFVSNGRLDQGEVGKTLRVTVTHDGSLNSCWGTIFVEDKNIPELICGMDTISCDDDFMDPNGTFWDFNAAEDRYRGFPIPESARAFPVSGLVNTYALINFDFCGSDTLRYSDDDDPLSCQEGMSRRILRTWSITSRSGFTPIVCVDTIYVEKLDIDSIDFRDLLPHQSYRCDQKSTILGDDGYPNPEITGTLDDLKDDPCYQLNAGYTDTKALLCGESMKFFRHWTIIDWCTTEDTTILQIISFEDKEDPAVSRPVVFDNVSADHECTNTFSIRRPTFTDCSEIIEVRLELRKVGDANWTLWGTKTVTDEDFIDISFGSEGDVIQARYVLTDACGNIGESSASNSINIQDNITPVAVCDEEVVITLNDQGVAYATYKTFDDGSTDNCGIVKYEIRRLSTQCDDIQSLQWGPLVGFCCFDLGNDDIAVELRVTDEAGNSNTCEAKVSIQELATKIRADNVPPDVTVSCGTDLTDLVGLYGVPVFLASQCGQKLDPSEVVIRNVDNCGKGTVTRTWTAINSFGAEIEIELETGETVLSVQQVITVGSDDEVLIASDIVWPDDIDTLGCISSLDPKDHPYLGFPIFENAPCSQPIATYDDQIFKNTEGYCAKVIRTWKVIDWCTVDSLNRNDPNALFFEHVQFIKLQDNVDPVITSGDTDQTLDANTADCRGFYTFTATGTDDCETDLLKWIYEIDIDNNGSIDATGKSNAFDITLPAGTHKIDWTLSDGCDNIDQVSQMITIDDTGCDVNTGNLLTISGKLFTENNHTVDNVNVRLTNAFGSTIMQQMTPINGEYAFEDITAHAAYNVEPVKNDNYGNGVSTLDMVLIQNHILGLRSFDSPYKVIAADVNGTNSVSAADVIIIRQLVLGLSNEFPIGRSWSFVDAALSFDNILSPFPYVDIISMNDLDYSPTGMDFIAVKMGDVSGDVTLASATQSRSRKNTTLSIENESVDANKMFSIPFKSTEAIDLAGIQMGMSFDRNDVEFLGVYGNGFEVTSQNINEDLLKQGELVMSWNGNYTIPVTEGEAIFEVRFAAKTAINTADVIQMSDAFITSEMYHKSDDEIEIIAFTIETEEGSALSNELTLFQNTPNPFQTSTDIRFSIPNASYVQLDIYDLSGQSVFHHEEQYDAGMNKVRISSDILTEGGLYIYQVADGNQIVQKKMIYIK